MPTINVGVETFIVPALIRLVLLRSLSKYQQTSSGQAVPRN